MNDVERQALFLYDESRTAQKALTRLLHGLVEQGFYPGECDDVKLMETVTEYLYAVERSLLELVFQQAMSQESAKEDPPLGGSGGDLTAWVVKRLMP